MTPLPPRVVVVTRPSPYAELLLRHGTHEQGRFFLESRDLSIEPLVAQHRRLDEARGEVESSIPHTWRRARADRRDLDRFVFEPEDIVVAVGQDGLVANCAKYLTGQFVVGINPNVEQNVGILVPHEPRAAGKLLAACATGRPEIENRTMVHAALDDGQELFALNEIFVGHRTHQSARYRLRWRDRSERQSSSGLIVSSGTGATGWALSLHRQRHSGVELPAPAERRLVFMVREAFPSVASQAELTDGVLAEGETLEVVSEMNDDGVIFGDGIEADRLEFRWGQIVRIGLCDRCLRLVLG